MLRAAASFFSRHRKWRDAAAAHQRCPASISIFSSLTASPAPATPAIACDRLHLFTLACSRLLRRLLRRLCCACVRRVLLKHLPPLPQICSTLLLDRLQSPAAAGGRWWRRWRSLVWGLFVFLALRSNLEFLLLSKLFLADRVKPRSSLQLLMRPFSLR